MENGALAKLKIKHVNELLARRLIVTDIVQIFCLVTVSGEFCGAGVYFRSVLLVACWPYATNLL